MWILLMKNVIYKSIIGNELMRIFQNNYQMIIDALAIQKGNLIVIRPSKKPMDTKSNFESLFNTEDQDKNDIKYND